MTFLPIVERELRGAARLTSTYRNRVIVAAIVTGVAMIMLAFGTFSTTPSQVGRAMFWTLTYLAMVFCLFEGARKTADCVSEEKREGTLGLLFLTDLKGYDVVLGKLTGKSLSSVYGLISILPILALPLLLGGITGGEYWRVVLALGNLLFFSLALGLFISCACRDERHAMTATFLVLLAWVSIPLPFASVQLFSPCHAINAASYAFYKAMPANYWMSLGFGQMFAWAMLLWASLATPNCWREEKMRWLTAIRLPSWKKSPADAQTRAEQREKMLEMNPVYWLAGRNSGVNSRWMKFIGICWLPMAGAMFWLLKGNALWPYLGTCWLLNFCIKMRIAAESCHCFAEARRNSALEMLLVTPLTTEQIVNGQLLALRRTFLGPILGLMTLQIAGLVFILAAQSHRGFQDQATLVAVGGGLAVYLGMFVLDVVAVAWTGMSFGLSSKKESQALTKTIGIVLVLPLLSSFFFCYGFIFVVGIPIICIANHRVKLRHEFRKLAGQPYSSPADQAWLPGLTPENPSGLQQMS